MGEDDISFTNPSRGLGVLPLHIGRTWSKLAVTSSNQFLPVVVHG